MIPGLGRSPGEGNGNRLQYSCLENSIDRGDWQAIVHGVSNSRTQLVTRTHTHTHTRAHTQRHKTKIENEEKQHDKHPCTHYPMWPSAVLSLSPFPPNNLSSKHSLCYPLAFSVILLPSPSLYCLPQMGQLIKRQVARARNSDLRRKPTEGEDCGPVNHFPELEFSLLLH